MSTANEVLFDTRVTRQESLVDNVLWMTARSAVSYEEAVVWCLSVAEEIVENHPTHEWIGPAKQILRVITKC